MIEENVYRQLLNVMEGYTADGLPFRRPIPFPDCNETIRHVTPLIEALAVDLQMTFARCEDDLDRTLVIQALVRWLKLSGVTTVPRLRWLAERVTVPDRSPCP